MCHDLQILDDMEEEMVKLIKKHYGKTGDDTSEAFTEGLDYVQEEVCVCDTPSSSQTCSSHYYGQLKHHNEQV